MVILMILIGLSNSNDYLYEFLLLHIQRKYHYVSSSNNRLSLLHHVATAYDINPSTMIGRMVSSKHIDVILIKIGGEAQKLLMKIYHPPPEFGG